MILSLFQMLDESLQSIFPQVALRRKNKEQITQFWVVLPIPLCAHSLAHFHTGSVQWLCGPLCPQNCFTSAVSTALPAVESLIVQQPHH